MVIYRRVNIRINFRFIGRQVAKIGTAFEATNHESTLQYLFGKNLVKSLIIF